MCGWGVQWEILNLEIEELAKIVNISTVFTTVHIQRRSLFCYCCKSDCNCEPLYWDRDLSWERAGAGVPRWMQEWIPEGQFCTSSVKFSPLGQLLKEWLSTQLLRKCFQCVCSADEEYPMLLMNCQKNGTWVGHTSYLQTEPKHTYLVRRLTMIKKVVPLGWGLSIAHRLGWPLRLPQMWVTRARNFC